MYLSLWFDSRLLGARATSGQTYVLQVPRIMQSFALSGSVDYERLSIAAHACYRHLNDGREASGPFALVLRCIESLASSATFVAKSVVKIDEQKALFSRVLEPKSYGQQAISSWLIIKNTK